MSDEFELELSDDELSELRRVSFALGITPEEAAIIALREFMEDVETGRRGHPAPPAEEEE
ncbi:MAG: hypothetical protein ACO3DI_07935 [Ilumatobacteraceae bacterium]|jgi:HEAT repeat protein